LATARCTGFAAVRAVLTTALLLAALLAVFLAADDCRPAALALELVLDIVVSEPFAFAMALPPRSKTYPAALPA
jgi:hypothetical protein